MESIIDKSKGRRAASFPWLFWPSFDVDWTAEPSIKKRDYVTRALRCFAVPFVAAAADSGAIFPPKFWAVCCMSVPFASLLELDNEDDSRPTSSISPISLFIFSRPKLDVVCNFSSSWWTASRNVHRIVFFVLLSRVQPNHLPWKIDRCRFALRHFQCPHYWNRGRNWSEKKKSCQNFHNIHQSVWLVWRATWVLHYAV